MLSSTYHKNESQGKHRVYFSQFITIQIRKIQCYTQFTASSKIDAKQGVGKKMPAEIRNYLNQFIHIEHSKPFEGEHISLENAYTYIYMQFQCAMLQGRGNIPTHTHTQKVK